MKILRNLYKKLMANKFHYIELANISYTEGPSKNISIIPTEESLWELTLETEILQSVVDDVKKIIQFLKNQVLNSRDIEYLWRTI